MSITNTIKSIQDIMRKDVGVDGDAQRLSQLVWMLFLKIFDDREIHWELLQENYSSPLPEKYRWRNWASNPEGITGDGLKEFIDNEMFPALQNLEIKSNDQKGFVVRSVFQGVYNYMKSGQLIRQVVNKIQDGIDFNKAHERHLFGEMYEQLLRDLQAAGNAGEFYTPRPITEFMVRMVDPKLGEKIMDPACGTGGFLTSTIDHIRNNEVKTIEDESLLHLSISGVEKKPMPHLLCTTNMILHGIDIPINIKHDNTLARPLISWTSKDKVDIVVTNPPFGGNEEDGIETNFPTSFRSKETADLFLVLIMHLLKKNGRAALVLPDGFITGEGIKARIKEKILNDCNLHTIVRLPNSVFSPYTNIKTNLLFFDKGLSTKEIWFYEQTLPKGVKSYNKTNPMKLSDLDDLIKWWGNPKENFKTRKINSQAWKVSLDEVIKNNYNLDFKNPFVKNHKVYDPDLTLSEYSYTINKMISSRNNLKNILSKNFQDLDLDNLSKSWIRFDKNFDSLFMTESSIEELKKILCYLAINGKLIKSKKKLKNATLKNLGDWAVGNGFPKDYQGNKSEDILFSKVSDMNNPGNERFIHNTNNTVSEKVAKKLKLNLHQPGTVIFPKIGGAIATNKRRILVKPTAIDNNCLGITPNKNVSTEWLFLVLSTIDFSKYQAGTSVPALSQGVLEKIPTMLPEIDEQNKIIKKITEYLNLCDEVKLCINKSNIKHEQTTDILISDIKDFIG